MTFLKLSRLMGITVLILTALATMGNTRTDFRLQVSTPTATKTDCNSSPTMLATSPTEAVVTQSTPEATIEVAQNADSALQYVSFEPTDIHFNPDPNKPFALITVYSLIFQNQLSESLHIEKPQFQLAINGVSWGTLVSTDFQTGQLLPHATQGIVLQNLTIISKTTPEQKAILDCLKASQPVDLTLTWNYRRLSRRQ